MAKVEVELFYRFQLPQKLVAFASRQSISFLYGLNSIFAVQIYFKLVLPQKKKLGELRRFGQLALLPTGLYYLQVPYQKKWHPSLSRSKQGVEPFQIAVRVQV